jgi:hypothetical protein
MRAYELAAFQWSCETIPEPQADMLHKEWLNSQDFFPNFNFARSLKNHMKEQFTSGRHSKLVFSVKYGSK